MDNKDNRNKKIILFLLLFLVIGIAYAAIASNLVINGFSNIKNTSFDVRFENVTVAPGSVEIFPAIGDKAAAIDDEEKTKVTYKVSLYNPGDFYEFEVYAINKGSLEAKISEVVSKFNNETITDGTLPTYIKYTVKYADGNDIEVNETLSPNEYKKYKVRVEYRNDIDPSLLPTTEIELNFSFKVVYVQNK